MLQPLKVQGGQRQHRGTLGDVLSNRAAPAPRRRRRSRDPMA
jgi:hypothetical protein